MIASLFPQITHTHGQHVDLDWTAFAERYLCHHDVRRRKDGRLFSFAIYNGSPERGDANVRSISGVVIDFDNKIGEGNDAHCAPAPTVPEHHFENLGDITYAWYSTHQNSPEWPRWRLVFPLDREVLPHEWPAVFDGAMSLLGRDENIDTTCGELSRAYYTPSCAPESQAAAFAGFHEGRVCTVDELLSMTSVVIGQNVHSLPGANARNPGRNNRLKGIASAMLGRQEPVEAIVLELVRVDAEHNPPLFTDRTEGFKGTAEAGALKFLGNIALSHSAGNANPDPIALRAAGEAYAPQALPPGESLLTMLGDVVATLAAPRWLVRRYLEAETFSVLFGEPGAGKSFVALDLALSIALGRAWHGHKVKQTPVVYICGEGYAGLQRRAWAWQDWHEADLRGAPFALTKRAVPLVNDRAIKLLQDDIDRLCDRMGNAPGQFFIDTLARNFGGLDENSTKDMGSFVEHVALGLMDRYHAGAMAVHHSGHGDKTRARGSSSLRGAVDAEYIVARQPDGLIEFTSLKMKDAAPPETKLFSMRSVDLPIKDDEGETVTSLVPVAITATAPPVLRPGHKGGGENQIACLDVLEGMFAERRATLMQSGMDPLRARVSVQEWRQELIERGLIKDRRRFHERRESMEAAGLIVVDNGFVSPCSTGGQ